MGRLDTLLDVYFKEFGKSYPLVVASDKTDEEIIADIKNCLENGEPAEEPKYEADYDY